MHLEQDSTFPNRGIPKRARVGFKMLAGLEASMDGASILRGFAVQSGPPG